VTKYPETKAGQRATSTLLSEMIPTIVVKASTTERASTTTLTLDPELQFSAVANGVYLVEFNLLPGATLAADFTTEWSVPSGASGFKTVIGPGSSASDGDADNINMRCGTHQFGTDVTYSGVRNDNGNAVVVYEAGIVTIGSTAGTVGIAWAQEASQATATKLWTGSYMIVQRLA
jgi:hypothetical protein